MTFGFGLGVQRLGSVAVATLSDLNAINPGSSVRPMGFVTGDGTVANNGIYAWTGSAWVKQRGLPDGLGSYTGVAGTANAITATLASGVDPAVIRAAVLLPTATNTGAVTLNGEAIKSRSGGALGAGALQSGVAALLWRDGSSWRLMTGNIAEISEVTGLQAALDAKADAYSLAAKADASALASGLAGKIDASALDTDSALSANSDAKVPSQKAVKTYVDAAVSTILGGVSSAYDTLSEIATAITGILANSWVTTARIADKAVTYAKLQDVSATGRVLGRKTAGAGVAEELSLSDVLDFIGSATRGDILYRGASAWQRLGKGAAGQILTQGANDPAWADLPAGGMTLLTTITTTAVGNIEVTSIAAGYRELVIEYEGVKFSTSASLIISLSTNNGSSWGSGKSISPSSGGSGNQVNGSAKIMNFASTVSSVGARWVLYGGYASAFTGGSGELSVNGAGAVNAIRFNPSPGNFQAGGTIRVYGVK